jgi:hypothetical protein
MSITSPTSFTYMSKGRMDFHEKQLSRRRDEFGLRPYRTSHQENVCSVTRGVHNAKVRLHLLERSVGQEIAKFDPSGRRSSPAARAMAASAATRL